MTDTQTSLLALAARCEAALGPHRDLDADIWRTQPGYSAKEARASGIWPRGADREQCAVRWRKTVSPDYTASLDAAMTLVPQGLRLMLSEWDDDKYLRARGPWQAVLWARGCDASFDAMRGYRCNHAATPALALCAAALRARAAMETPDD